jgi:trehalose/maltose hydrolase-like predicted phosphorylase
MLDPSISTTLAPHPPVFSPPLLDSDRTFRFIVWNACESKHQTTSSTDVSEVVDLFDRLLGAGLRAAIVSKNSIDHWMGSIDKIQPTNRHRLFVISQTDGALVRFDHRGATLEVEVARHAFSTRSDALKYLLEHEILPRAIDPSLVLVIDDFDSTDVVNEEDPENLSENPGVVTAPRCEISRLADILHRQTQIDAQLGVFAPSRDATWLVVEQGFDVTREHEIESLLAIANGYVGVRGSIAEGSDVSRPATFLAGVFEQSMDMTPVPELVIAPDWGRLRFTIEGERFSAASTMMLHHHRTLDLRRGLLLRQGIAQGTGGHSTEIRTLHAASLASRHLLLEFVEIIPKNFSGTILVEAILSGDVKSESGKAHWNRFELRDSRHGPILVGTTHGGLQLAVTSHTSPVGRDDLIVAKQRDFGPTWALERCELRVSLGESGILQRVVGMYSSRDDGDPITRADALEREVVDTPPNVLLDEHVAAWALRWQRANIEIDGAPKIERALRFGMYHLLGAVHPTDDRISIGARALSGQAYRGHVFWDTEIFMAPFFMHAWPEAARTLLRYRHRTLDGARRKAQKFHFRGAMYAWESADTGDETTPTVGLTASGEIVPILSGFEEHHISADVAYAIWQYVRATGDHAFLEQQGAEILMETARFWASRGQWRNDGKYHIDRVIGPDEYHEGVNDNAYTNHLARKNLLWAAQVARGIGANVASILRVDTEEIAQWEKVAADMYLGLDESTSLIEQHQGFFALEQIDLAAFSPRTVPMDVLLGRQRTQNAQIVKQADVVQLIAMLWDEIDPRVRRKSYLYYEPRTAHGSSLSPGVYAWVAARLGLLDLAARYLDQTSDIDLGNNMGNSAGGVHAAAMGSLWQAVVFGLAGLHQAVDDPECLNIDPNLLPNIRRLSLPYSIRGRQLEIHICRKTIEVHCVTGPSPIKISVSGPSTTRREAFVEPGHTLASQRTTDGYSAWEEISS